MIIAGYPGVGKSTWAKENPNVIDWESSVFSVDGKKVDGWEKIYVEQAINLSNAGYIVLTSTHAEILNMFKIRNEIILVVYPALELEQDWKSMLYKRWTEDTTVTKNKAAYDRALTYYSQDICSLYNRTGVIHVEIKEKDEYIKQAVVPVLKGLSEDLIKILRKIGGISDTLIRSVDSIPTTISNKQFNINKGTPCKSENSSESLVGFVEQDRR